MRICKILKIGRRLHSKKSSHLNHRFIWFYFDGIIAFEAVDRLLHVTFRICYREFRNSEMCCGGRVPSGSDCPNKNFANWVEIKREKSKYLIMNGLIMNLIFAVDIEIHDRPGLFSFTEDLQYQTEFC